MHLEFLLEEPSAEEALKNILPKILGDKVSFSLFQYGGKQKLLKRLPDRLKGYHAWIPGDYKIVILIDMDDDNCQKLKKLLNGIALRAGLTPKGSGKTYSVINRIAIEELEAWFFGDENALTKAYPRVRKNISTHPAYRNPDNIKGGTWEALEKILQKAGYYKGGLQKIRAAKDISAQMSVDANRSKSFQVFRDGLMAAIA
jgi:hypothetical protein